MFAFKIRKALLVVLALAVSSLSWPAWAQEKAADPSTHWSYSGDTGPTHWGDLNPGYILCSTGKAQSPIDITQSEKAKLPEIQFHYQDVQLSVINNGHTIQVNYPAGSYIVVGDKRYELVQFHFHHQSETAINGKHAPMELHLVHKDSDGKLAVVAVLLKEGKASDAVATVWKSIPSEVGQEYSPTGVRINAKDLLPTKHTYYTFAGSLTTPPCSEGVTWMVLSNESTVSKEQVEAFAKLYPDNARPVQPLNGRVVKRNSNGGEAWWK